MLRTSAEIRIPVIPGDGVGPELIEAACLCLDAVGRVAGLKFSYVGCAAGYASYVKHGRSLPEETIETMKSAPATLLGAISSKDCPRPSPMGQMRKALGLFADIRACFSVPGSPRPGVDVVLVRECSEGFLSDRNMFAGTGEFMPTPDVVLSTRVISRQKCEQIASLAYDYARKHGRRRVTIAHKEVVFTLGCGMFRDIAQHCGAGYKEIETTEESVDTLAGHLVSEPERYDVILATNLFGDILGDVAAAQVGKLVPIINAGKDAAVFYPAHGAMKQLAGQGQVNPLAMLHAVSAMLHWSGLDRAGAFLDNALSACHGSALCSSASLPAGTSTSQVVRTIIGSIDGQRR